MICKNCGQPMYETEATTGYKGVVIWMRGRYRHVAGDELYCRLDQILAGTPPATCHICGTTTAKHGGHCSARGKPRHRAGGSD